MNTHTEQPTQPFLKPQPPQSILIEQTRFSYTYGVFSMQAGLMTAVYTDLKIQALNHCQYTLDALIDNKESFETIALIGSETAALLSIWIDRCKGVQQ